MKWTFVTMNYLLFFVKAEFRRSKFRNEWIIQSMSQWLSYGNSLWSVKEDDWCGGTK